MVRETELLEQKKRAEIRKLRQKGRVLFCSGIGAEVVKNPPEVSEEVKGDKCYCPGCANYGHCHYLAV